MEGNVDILKHVGKKIREIRKNRGLSQEALGEKAGLSSNYVGQIERGQKQVTLTTLAKIAESLEIDVSQLFEESTSKKVKQEEELSFLIESAKILSLRDLKIVCTLAGALAKR